MAGKSEDATLLIPDLQRPYVWLPSQVIVLVDSLIRGWPFGTLLTWKVRPDDPARDLARSFWRVVDRTGDDEGHPISMKHPPATFQMVLDGQQRVQSLLLALGGDGWGFKLFDRQWHEHLSGTKPRGPRGKPHWSLGCLCVDVPALSEAYSKTKRATAIDYSKVLQWVVTDEANGQSKLAKPPNYLEPLKRSSASAGQFVRLARLWEAAPEQASIDPYEAEDLADTILAEHGVSGEVRNHQKRPTGALLMALKEVKQTRVTYLELAEYEEALGSRETYNDAVVNIFTRLNTAGRTLTREDITFAWLKIGCNTGCTQNESAKACIQALAQQLEELSLSISLEDVVSAISFIWSVSFNSGNILNNNDLMKGEAIRPMAANISENWDLVVEAATRICAHARDRGLRFREHYQSVNSLAYLWAWYFAALCWRQQRKPKELEKDSLDKSLAATLDALMDRWLICSQWAGVWTSASAQSLGGYANRLAACALTLAEKPDVASAIGALSQQLQSEVKDMEQASVNGLAAINADDRQQVRTYYTALWLWNRLEKNRWKKAKLALRQESRRQNSLEVDHIVAWDLWKSKLAIVQPSPSTGIAGLPEQIVASEPDPRVNELGNCMLLEKNFNISKSNRPLKEFLEGVHEFKEGTVTIEEWAAALELQMPQVDSATTTLDVLGSLFADRTLKIRGDLEQFARGMKARIDLQAN
jgi:5-methylcytosine-specific restriction endonuclease McrA